MNPELLTQGYWDDINRDVLYLALLHLSVVAFAGSILLARTVIPSLVYTGHAPERAGRLRPVFFALAAAAGISAIIFAVLWISNLDVFYDIYDRVYY
jgi:hypothetical protein